MGRIPFHFDWGGSSVFQLSITQQQRFSNSYLQQLCQIPTTRFWLKGDLVLSNLALPNSQVSEASFYSFEKDAEQYLLVFSEGLNLEKIAAVIQRLSPHLAFSWFTAKSCSFETSELCIKIAIKNATEIDLSVQLESLAMQLQVELVLIKDSPQLSKPGLLLMDMDSTVIKIECIDEIAVLAGVGEKVSNVTELAMQGKLDFAESLNSRVACLAGVKENALLQVRDALPLMPGITRLIGVLKQNNWKVAIASGGFTFFADYLLERLELDAAVANTLEIKDGKLTGKVLGGIVDANVKAQTLERLAEQWHIEPSQTIAMGDGANDLVMMKRAALGVAYHAKPMVRQQAAASIRFGGLDSVLWMLAD